MTETINVANIDKVHKNQLLSLFRLLVSLRVILIFHQKARILMLKSLMGIMAFGLRDGMSVTISAEGNDADKAVEAIKKFLIGE